MIFFCKCFSARVIELHPQLRKSRLLWQFLLGQKNPTPPKFHFVTKENSTEMSV